MSWSQNGQSITVEQLAPFEGTKNIEATRRSDDARLRAPSESQTRWKWNRIFYRGYWMSKAILLRIPHLPLLAMEERPKVTRHSSQTTSTLRWRCFLGVQFGCPGSPPDLGWSNNYQSTRSCGSTQRRDEHPRAPPPSPRDQTNKDASSKGLDSSCGLIVREIAGARSKLMCHPHAHQIVKTSSQV